MNEIILELSAGCISLFCLADCLKNRKSLYLPLDKKWLDRLKNQRFTYLMLLMMLIVSASASALEVALEESFHVKSSGLLWTINMIYFIFHTPLSFLFTLYVINMTNVAKSKKQGFFLAFLSPFFLAQFMVLINPFTKLIFYVDESFHYQRGPMVWLLYLTAFIYIVLGLVYFFKYRSRMGRTERYSAFILMSVTIIGICIQGFFSITVELFFEAISFLGFMLLLEEPEMNPSQNKRSRISKSFILVIALIFTTVIIMNINLIYHAGTDQAEKIGKIQIDNLSGEFQETISEAEGNLLRFSMGLEQLVNEGASSGRVEAYIRVQKDYYTQMTGSTCFNVYAAATDWTIIPDFDMPAHYHATERLWYTGAAQHEGEVYITEPYVDAATTDLCFTLSYLLSDGKTVAAMDFTLLGVQDIVQRMGNAEGQLAMIVTDEGTVVGCSDLSVQGKKLSDALPEYADIFEWVKASNEHRGFDVTVEGSKKKVFSSETGNGWQLILIENSDILYGDIYRQMIMLGAIDMLMVVVIIVFYMVSIDNQDKSERALSMTESFIAGISEDLKKPLQEIIKITERSIRGEDADTSESLMNIRESGNLLREKMDNLFSYAGLIKTGIAEGHRSQSGKLKGVGALSSRYIRNGIIGILAGVLLASLALTLVTTTRWGQTRITKEADRYNDELTLWVSQQISILRMFSDVIAADPSVMEDYDQAVAWLDGIAKNYSDMSVCYLANPYNTEHQVIMNNGWVPEPGYRVEERQWYKDTERSGKECTISAPYFDSQTGLYCITFSRSVYSKEGDFLGIFAIDCYINKLIDVLDDSYTKDGYAFLVDQDGVILNHPDKTYEMSSDSSVNIEDTGYFNVYHTGSAFFMKDYDDRYVTAVTAKSDISGFTVVMVQRWWTIYGAVLVMAVIFLVMMGASIFAVATMINRFITWQEESNIRLKIAAEEAVSAGKAKSQFLAQMSHEIRTPINAVLGMNEMILRESGDASILDYAENIRTAGRNLLSLINTILDFSKIEEGKMEIVPVRYETPLLVDGLIQSVEQRARDKGLTFEAHVDPQLPSVLYGDDMRLTQVIVNLLTNAVKYTPSGRVDLYLSSVRSNEDVLLLGVKVKDTGIGIKKEDREKLFESFTRLDETRNRSIEGTGLGMAIVTKLLEMMHTSLSVESEYGKGSEFSFEVQQSILDAQPIGDYKKKIREAAGSQEKEKHLYAPKAKLLVVDDNDLNLKVIKNLLKLNGIVPDLASSGKQALEMMGQKAYDVVLLDHMMPQMDGIETLKRAKEDGLIAPGETVIALTANAVVGARESYLKAGFDDYLSKPVEVRSMEHALSKYLPQDILSYQSDQDIKAAEGMSPVAEHPETEIPKAEKSEGETSEVLEFPALEPEKDDTKDPAGDDLFERLEHLSFDIKAGLGYCMNDESFYREILGDYADSCEERLEQLAGALESGDLGDYRIQVHALKSVAKSVGDESVYERALALEEAAAASDEKTVRNGHEPMAARYRRSKDAILGG
ncbi:MAG: response regulator [Lachnospiraceae bacterium]|nr:response regulator [Lachnospiraceae bacterium]